METDKDEVVPSCGCVFCDLELSPTNCTDGWFHLLKDGSAIPCPASARAAQPGAVKSRGVETGSET